MQVRVDDAAGNQNDPKPSRTFSAVAAGDAATPTGTVTAPANNAAVSAPVTHHGHGGRRQGRRQREARDPAERHQPLVERHRLAVDGHQGQRRPETPGRHDRRPGATRSPAIPTGGYGFSTDITDTAGKLATGTGKPAWRNFTVTG